MKRVLVFGASGQIGESLLPLLRESSCDALAVSRKQRAATAGVAWIVGALDEALSIPDGNLDAVFSLGPLDVFARWLERTGPIAPRVIAFGSTSVATKSGSTDPSERNVSARLRVAEDGLFSFGAKHGVAVTVLRPTLIYGRGRDRTLSRIAALARRYGVFALPRNATGLRQPVHADDLAVAALAASQSPGLSGRAYDVPGGETLTYIEMVARTLAVLQPRPRLLRVPSLIFRAMLGSAQTLGLIDAMSPAMVSRLDTDLVFDATDARRDFAYAPRAFTPDAAMFTPKT
jgi:nucleoside-diphosphate-sugar epimerase